ncbi:TnsD family transposase [Neobacillus sp. PS3-40]|uniref:TnsD family transposase n=1 Tax=Neobacillus sp. PS3-40 TaxID=3070679 RepID=UPI0027E1A3E0|nr:TnsD family transposase [Neobacillus sp. PS3-40]WML42638.1 TnsD family transposase [Neobacillus sp. PS3-40]
MLAYFPKLYEDELLYSWFARYHVHSANISPKQTMKDLFGTTNAIAIPDLPTHLNEVYGRIKHFDIPSIDQLIKEHTLFRYYTAFQPKHITDSILELMKIGNRLSTVYLMTGVAASSVKEWGYFRFCPSCIREDTQSKGEPYWHVSQQIPGVHICSKHGEYLFNSTVEFRNGKKHEFFAASGENCLLSNEINPHTERITTFLKMIVEQSSSLILKDFSLEFKNIHRSYKSLLIQNGLANANGTINQRNLAEQFKLFYGEVLLNIVQSSVSYENPSCWLKNITRKHRKTFHPIRHILFIHFLTTSLENQNKFSEIEYQPFGKAPYHCLNPAALHYKERVISDMQISLCNDTKRPVGTFSCSCGFVYSRRGPDKYQEDAFKFGRIKKFGHVWEDKLKQLVHHENKSWYAAAKEMKCDIGTVKKYSKKILFEENQSNINKVEIAQLKQIDWLLLLKMYPEHTVTTLREIAPALYMWHYRNNLEWFKNNSPKQKINTNISKRIDWSERDNKVLHDMKEAFIYLKSIEKPTFINRSRIGKEIGCLALLEKHLHKMPRTKQYLESNIESREEFQIRRIIWACQKINDSGQEVVMWRVKRKAGIKENVNPQVFIYMEEEILKYKEGVQNTENQTMAIFERNSDTPLAWQCQIEEQSMVHTDWLYM